MKRFLILILLIMLLFPFFSQAQWSHEKINGSFVDHSMACMAITLGSYAVLDYAFPDSKWNKVAAFAVGMAAGLLKEFFEDKPDQIDLAADFTGCCIGTALTLCWTIGEKKVKLK